MIKHNGNTIHLMGKSISYVLTVKNGDLLNYHFGKMIADEDYSARGDKDTYGVGFSTNMRSLDVMAHDYPSYGRTDLRNGAYELLNSFGNTLSETKVTGIHISEGCPSIPGMPSLFSAGRGMTAEITLTDEIARIGIKLFYTVFDEYDIIARSAVITNLSDSAVTLSKACSASLDVPYQDMDMIYFSGSWGKERELQKTPVRQGLRIALENNRGGSGHQLNPFAMLATHGATEDTGEVYGFSLIYSGNHSTTAEVDQFSGLIRVLQGISPTGFSQTLAPGESFYTPQSVLAYSAEGIGALSRTYHDVYRSHLMRSTWTNKNRPLLLNNWEGTYFDFTEEKLIALAEKAKEIGLDLFVLDDGWFGKRDSDNCSLGDWIVNKKKLPSGLDGLADKINRLGLKFGLWFEPEMVNRDSELYRKHPDWAITVNEREPVEIRHQLILDLSKDEVCEYIIDAVSAVLSSANIEYVKWDMNRQMTDMPYPGYNHKYTLGFYKIMSAITERFPDILFEGCSAGGGRFDPGVLAYMPQIWTSDNSDAISRLKIQYSTTMCYPVYSVSTHVSASPNHQTNRATTLKARADTAYAGTFGYELDLTALSEDELNEIKEQIAFDRHLQALIRKGDLYRLESPYEGNCCSWEIVSKDRSHVFLYACRILFKQHTYDRRIRLRGLDPDATYADSDGKKYSGSLLMHRGIDIPYPWGDFATAAIKLKKV